MAVIGREGRAHHGGAKAGEHFARFPRIQHAILKAVIARFALHLFQALSTFIHFTIGKA